MRYIIILLLLIAGTAILLPIQKEEEKKFVLQKTDAVQLNLKFADSIYIKAVDGNELNFHLVLKSTDSGFRDAHAIDYKHKENTLSITTNISDEFWHNKYNAEKDFKYKSKLIICKISVPRNHPIAIETITGNVQIRGMENKLRVKTISGFIDCDWTEQPTDIYLSSVTGEIYTDINVNYSTPIQDMPIVGYPLRGRIKKGGTNLHLETVADNIYLRQRK